MQQAARLQYQPVTCKCALQKDSVKEAVRQMRGRV